MASESIALWAQGIIIIIITIVNYLIMSCFAKWPLFDSISECIINYTGLKQVSNYCRDKIHAKDCSEKNCILKACLVISNGD